MLLVAIPKSGSTSLMTTLGSLHNMESLQMSLENNARLTNLHVLGKYHSDIREITLQNAREFARHDMLYKQHIPPTPWNIRLLETHRKVVLLRKPVDIIHAYFRAERAGIHASRPEFAGARTITEWIRVSNDIGLLADLDWFYNQWVAQHRKDPESTHLVHFDDLLREPTRVVNTIEHFWSLPTTSNVSLKKERYSRISTARQLYRSAKRMLRRFFSSR